MSIKLGNSNINKLYLGNTEIKKAYLGNELIFDKTGTTLKDGLISAWEFDEAIGNTLYDIHGANHGNNIGALINQEGLINKCFYFDGNNDHIELPQINFDRTDPFTFSFWIKRDNINDVHTLISNQEPYTYRGYYFVLDKATNNNVLHISIRSTLSSQITVRSSILIPAEWTHIVITYDGSSNASGVNVYIDSVKDLSLGISQNNLTSSMISSEVLKIGMTNQQNAIYKRFKGLFDQSGVWSRALNESEIIQLYNNGNGLAYRKW